MFNNISNRLNNLALSIIGNDTTITYKPHVIIHNPNTNFKLIPMIINAIDIVQNFSASYMDAIQLEVRISYFEYVEILKNMQDLECVITLNPANPSTGFECTELEPIIIEARAILENQEDLSKTIGESVFTNGDAKAPTSPEQASFQMNYTFHLIEHKAFDLRHAQINAILTGCTVEQAIRYVCSQFGIEKIVLIEPDNKLVYDNFVIPPMKDMSNVFSYIQDRYGVYSKGISWYYTQETLYVYPTCDTSADKNTTEGILRIASVPKGMFKGADNYHIVYDKDLYILSISDKEMKSLNTVGEENAGGVRLSVNSDNTVDGFSTLHKDGTLEISNDNLSVVQMSNKNGSMSGKSANVKYDGIRSNIYVSTSEMALFNGSVLSLGWSFGIPRYIVPGQVLEYYYDESSQIFATKKGRIQSVSYCSTTQPTKSGNQQIFTFFTTLGLFLDPEKETDE